MNAIRLLRLCRVQQLNMEKCKTELYGGKLSKNKMFDRLTLNHVTQVFIITMLISLYSGRVFGQTLESQSSSINGFAENKKEKEAILTKREQWRLTFEVKNVENIMSFYVPDILSYDLMAPIQFEGEEMWRENWVHFFDAFKGGIRLTFKDLTVFQSGDLATIRGLTRLRGTTVNGEDIDMWTRETNVLRKINGEWLIVHDHISVPMDFETGKALTGLKPLD